VPPDGKTWSRSAKGTSRRSSRPLLMMAYPSRMNSFTIVDPPWFARMLVAVISRIMAPKFLQRLRFFSRDELHDAVDEENLLQCLGGKLEDEPDVDRVLAILNEREARAKALG
jgi:CRAL/TRIO domain